MSQTCNCERCGRKCQTSETTNADARLIRKSIVPKGLCVDCAITCFIKTGPLMELIPGGKDAPPGFGIVEVLSMPHIQKQFSAVFVAGGCADAKSEISWPRVIGNWDLALPEEGWDWKGNR
jgi:hypothetical protein